MAHETPVISVVTPLYNAGRWILGTIQSVRAQSITAWEMIIVDDGSTDDGPNLVQIEAARDTRISFFQQPNAGPAAARNAGALRARGQWLAFLDADDLLPPERFAIDLQTAQQNRQARLISGGAEWFTGEGNVTHQALLPSDMEVNRWRHQFHAVYNFSGILLRRDVHQEAGGFNSDEAIRYAEDYDYTLRLLEKAELAQTQEIGVRVRKHESNRSALADRTVLEHTMEVIRRTWGRRGVELSVSQAEHLFRFWRQEPDLIAYPELQELIRTQRSLAHSYLQGRSAATKTVQRLWEQTLAWRIAEARLAVVEQEKLFSMEAAARGFLSASRVKLRVLKGRWRR